MQLAYFNLAITNLNGRSHSILSKIDQQAKTAKELGLPFDFFWLPGRVHPGDERYTHLKTIPVGGNNLLSVRPRQCKELRELMRCCDRAILRHPLMDPMLYGLLKNRDRMFLEHHTKETEELKTTGDLRLMFENTIAPSWMRRFRGLIAVTPEIVEYEVKRSGFAGPTAFFPNSVDLEQYSSSLRQPPAITDAPLKLIMVSTHFSPWHGLGALLDQIESAGNPEPFELHLVGQVDTATQSRCKSFPQIKLHGTLPGEKVQALYPGMDLGIGSLTFSTIGLTQGTPLKVREYLAVGLPIVIGYNDPAIPADFPYALKQERFDLAAMLRFARQHRGTPAETIREAAREHIDACVITKRLFDFCTTA